MTGPQPLDRRVTSLEKDLARVVELLETLTGAVDDLTKNVNGAPPKKDPARPGGPGSTPTRIRRRGCGQGWSPGSAGPPTGTPPHCGTCRPAGTRTATLSKNSPPVGLLASRRPRHRPAPATT